MKYKSKNNQFITSVIMACVIAITALGCGSGADFDIADDPVITNNVPVITSTPIYGAASGFEYSYTLTATDADAGDTLTMSATAPAWLTFDAETGVLSGTPSDEDEGDNSVTLTVSDGSDEVNQTFSIIVVVAPNSVPVITSTAVTAAVVDMEYSYTLTATDADPNDSVTLSATTVPAWLAFDAETGILSGTPLTEDIGSHAVSLSATDGTDAVNQDFNISVTETAVTSFVIFDDSERADWPAWDCCGGSVPTVETDDVDHGAVVEFSIGADPTVMGFTARDGDGAVGGVPFDARPFIESGTFSFDLKMTVSPGDTDWKFKIESAVGQTPVEVSLTTSNEGHAAPVLDTWQTYTFNLVDLQNLGLDLSKIDVVMVFPAWDTGNGAIYRVDNVMFSAGPPPPETSGLVIFDDSERADWPAWDCCGGSTPVEQTDDAEHGAVMEFSIGAAPTVMGFTARDGDGAVGGVPFDATGIVANGTFSFDLKMTATPGDTDWKFKIESAIGQTPVEVSLSTSNEGHTAPVLDTWQTYTFNLADLQALGLDVSAIDVVMVFPAWDTGNGAIYRIDNVSFLAGEVVEPPSAVELVIFDDSERADWPAWDCCGGSTPVEQTDDAEYGAVMEFSIGAAPTVMGFTAREVDGAVGGVPFDATGLVAEGTLSFDLKMTATPGDTDWKLKLESNGGATPVEVSLSTSNEGHAAPVLDTWQHYTFNLADLQALGLDVSGIDVVMVFPAWDTGNGAIYRIDNMSFLADGGVVPPAPAVELVIFDDSERADWPAWDCCGGSTPVEQTDDVDYGAVMEFSIGAAPTVMGFTAREVDGSVGGVPFDATGLLAEGTLSFDLKMTATPGDTDWKLKVESNGGATPVEVSLSTSNEGHAAPVLDTWQHYTFNLADLQTAGLDVSGIDVVMIFPAWDTGNGAIYRVDNVSFLADGAVVPPSGGDQIDLPINFDEVDTDYTVTDFGGTSTVLGANPTDGADQVAITTKSDTAETWAGTTMSTNEGLATAVPLTLTDSIMKVWVYSPDAGIPVRLKLENHLDATQTVETESVTTVVNTWEELTFDFTNEATGTEPLDPALHPTWIFDKASIFFNFGTTGADAGEKVYYWDDITFGN